MNNFEVIEIVGVSIIISIQVIVFIQTLLRIETFKKTFENNYQVVKIHIPLSHLENVDPKKILAEYSYYISDNNSSNIGNEGSHFNQISNDEVDNDNEVDDSVDETREIHLLIPGDKSTKTFNKVSNALNIYLLKNRGAASDFHLIKDVVERNTDVLESEITHTISIPLYLGLLGTMFGIVFGLYNISDLGASLNLDTTITNTVENTSVDEGKMNNGINILLSGVKIAMIASFAGLAFTVLNSGWLYKRAKYRLENTKNDFYTFLQTELLPVLNQNINSTLHSLQTNLFKFNDKFYSNINKLDGVMIKNYESLKTQQRMITSLQKMDVVKLAKANVDVITKFDKATEKFEKFTEYLENINEILGNSKEYVSQMNQVLDRTENLNALAAKIHESFEFNMQLQEFLQHHYSSLETTQQIFDEKLTGVNDILYQSLEQLKEFIQGKILEVQQISLKELELFEEKYPEKWQKLDNLEKLITLDDHVDKLRISSASQMERLKNELAILNDSFQSALSELEAIRINSSRTPSGLSSFINKIFKKEKVQDEG